MLPKSVSTGVRYLPSSAFNCYATFLDPDQGQATDGTPNPALTVASGIHANVAQWRGKEVDKPQLRIGQSSYKIVIRYPKCYTVDAGMQIQFTRGTTTHLCEIESISDPDGRGIELHIWCWENNAST
jgi:head-tail adaptor